MNELDCITGYIGLSASVSGTVQSGLYVDALPDISESQIAKLVDGESDTEHLWREIEKRGVLKFRTFFISQVGKTHRVTDTAKAACLICENKALLATALWYLLGEEVMQARKASSRLNGYTTLDKGKARELCEYFHDQFLSELDTAVNAMDIHGSECFSCSDQPEPADLITFREPVI